MKIDHKIITVNSPYYKDILQIRDNELRIPLGLSILDDDLSNEENEIIIGALINEKLVGCCLLKVITNAVLKLRQMAVSKDFQRFRIGTSIVSFAEEWARKNGYTTIELHAREEVSGFYAYLGYLPEGERFLEVNIPHVKMKKVI